MNGTILDRVLVVGSGSIAQRHVRNLLELGVGEVVVQTARDVSGVETFADPRVRVAPQLPEYCPPVAVIANDTDRHVASARELVGMGVDVLIEKPIADGFSAELSALQAEVSFGGRVARVAYNLRFLGAIRMVRDVLRCGELGQLLFARIEVGQWLPDWRPDRKLSELYSASAQRGGGVALDLSHEVDYMFMLFGAPVDWRVRSTRTGVLGIDAPDVFDGIYDFEEGFSATVHMDYLERRTRRRIRVVGSEGVLECDIAGKTMTLQANDGAIRTFDEPGLFDTERTYVDEVVSFIAEVVGAQTDTTLPTLDEAVAVLGLLTDRTQPSPNDVRE